MALALGVRAGFDGFITMNTNCSIATSYRRPVMRLERLCERFWSGPAKGARLRHAAARQRGRRPGMEQLEARTVLSSYAAATVSDLIADINASNHAGGPNTITLSALTASAYVLTAVDNTTDGPTGLPVIAANDNLTIVGNGDAIARSTAVGTADFRLFDVAAGATLTVKNLTLQGGVALGAGASAEGGGVFNQGTLDLNGVTVQNNTAQGVYGVGNAAGQPAAGGGLFSSGILTLEGGSKVQNNQAIGGNGGNGRAANRATRAEGGGPGGDGLGGGLFASGGSIILSSVLVSANTAQGGRGGGGILGSGLVGGIGCGGGFYLAGGSATLTGTSLSANTAVGGQGGVGPNTLANFPPAGGPGGSALGGGLNVAGGAVTLNSATLSANEAQGGQGGKGGAGAPGSLGGNGGAGGNAFGGGLNLAGGTATLTSANLSANSAKGGMGGQPGKKGAAAKVEYSGGNGGAGGNAYGGGLHASAGTITLRQDSVTRNSTRGGAGAPGNPGFPGFPSGQPGLPGLGEGGGIYIDALATAYLDAFTQANVINNTASTSDPNIHGTWHGI
jgi:hypothetical protein